MKKQFMLALLMFIALFQAAIAQEKGYITITRSATATHEVYDGAVAKLKQAGIWDLGWSFHAIGQAQPAGLFSIGVFPDKATADMRLAKVSEVYKANNLPVPTPDIYEIYTTFRTPIPATLPPNAVMIFHDVKGMTVAQYDAIINELKALNALNDPAQYFHACFKTPDGLKVVDIWESPEALQKFAGKLMPILTKIFGQEPPPPAVYGLYNVVSK